MGSDDDFHGVGRGSIAILGPTHYRHHRRPLTRAPKWGLSLIHICLEADRHHLVIDEELQEFDDDEMVPIGLETFLEIRELLKALYADANIPKAVSYTHLDVYKRQGWKSTMCLLTLAAPGCLEAL